MDRAAAARAAREDPVALWLGIALALAFVLMVLAAFLMPITDCYTDTGPNREEVCYDGRTGEVVPHP